MWREILIRRVQIESVDHMTTAEPYSVRLQKWFENKKMKYVT